MKKLECRLNRYPDNVGSSLAMGVNKLDESFDPSNFLKTKTFFFLRNRREAPKNQIYIFLHQEMFGQNSFYMFCNNILQLGGSYVNEFIQPFLNTEQNYHLVCATARNWVCVA